jgi:chaperonin cofactor prefoldin
MATTQDVDIDIDSDTVVVQNISVHDPDVVEYLESRDPDEQIALVERAFEIGLKTLQISETSRDLEHVKHEFDKMEDSLEAELDDVREELEERFGDDGEVASLLESHLGSDGKISAHLEEAFGEDGKLVERLDKELGEDGERIQDALNPDAEGTPTHQLKVEIKEEIRSIRDKITEEEARADERQDSWKGGEEFEETVGTLLDDLTYNTQDVVEHTGDEEGEIPGRDVGDYVLELGETGQRIVIEAKSEKSYTQPKIQDEMSDALENRNADYAIFVTECEAFVPDKVGYFQEYDRRILSVALSEEPDDNIEPGFLRIASNWAKFRLAQERMNTGDDLEPEEIHNRVEEVRNSIDRFQTLKSKCSDIESSAQEVKRLLDEIRDEISDDLNGITSELSKASPDSS